MINVLIGVPKDTILDTSFKETLDYLKERKYKILNEDLIKLTDESIYLSNFITKYKSVELVYLPSSYSGCIEYQLLQWLVQQTENRLNKNLNNIFTEADLSKLNQLGVEEDGNNN